MPDWEFTWAGIGALLAGLGSLLSGIATYKMAMRRKDEPEASSGNR